MTIRKFLQPTSLVFNTRTHHVGDIYTFSFSPNKYLDWHAGQHGLIELKLQNGKTVRRMFSLSSAPTEKIVSITTHWLGEEKASNFKKALWQLKPGDTARIRGPVGPMYVRNDQHNNVFIASGIGITPFRSILLEAVAQKQDLHGTLYYLNRGDNTPLFHNELLETVKKLPNMKIVHITNSEGFTIKALKQLLTGEHDPVFYIAGPPKMIKAYIQIIKDIRVPSSRIKTDSFRGYK